MLAVRAFKQRGGSTLTISAVKVGKTKNIGSTALRGAVETGARDISLALVLRRGCSNGGNGHEERDKELHDSGGIE